jgi:Uma2 family endonuclease
MAAERIPHYVTPEEYLAAERRAKVKSEYLSGQVYAMAGGSEAHNTVTVNVTTSLNVQLRDRPCRVYASDMRVQVSTTGLYTYPDVAVVCGEREFMDDRRDTLLNPIVIFEVLSPSTSDYDRGEKFAHYRRLPSLAEYVLVAQDRYRIEHYLRRSEEQWLFSEVSGPKATLNLVSIDCRLPLAEIYAKLDLTPPTSEAGGPNPPAVPL